MRHKHLFKCDIMVEDNWSNLVSSQYYHRILIDQPWNQNKKDYVYDVHRCFNWDDVIAAVNKINDGE